MENILGGGVAELEKVKEAVLKETVLNRDVDEQEAVLKAKMSELCVQRKFMDDKIETTLKVRRSEIQKNHDDRVDDANRSLKNAETRRKKAKEDAVDARIKNETSALYEEIGRLDTRLNQIFRDARIPKFCKHPYYYSMFAARTPKDFALFAVTVLITLGIIPNIVCFCIDYELWALKLIIYALIVVFFFAIYFVIYTFTKKGDKNDVIEQGRTYMQQIQDKKKDVKLVTKGIKHDMDESKYDLTIYDEDISHCQKVLHEEERRREEALKEFDTETAVTIRTEIENDSLPLINQLQAEVDELSAVLEDVKDKAISQTDFIRSEYGAYLGQKNLSVERLDEMIEIIQEEKATTILQALDIHKSEE